MKNLVLSTFLSFLCFTVFGQTTERLIEKQLRLSILYPGVEYELPISQRSSLASSVSIGFGGSYKNLKTQGSGFTYLISPHYELQYRNYYNIEKRNNGGKNIKHNSANYFGARLLIRGPEIKSSFSRTTEVDYAFGPTWGIQRVFNKIQFLFDVGPYIYFDMKGEYGFLPMFQLNIGYNLSK